MFVFTRDKMRQRVHVQDLRVADPAVVAYEGYKRKLRSMLPQTNRTCIKENGKLVELVDPIPPHSTESTRCQTAVPFERSRLRIRCKK